MRLRWLATIAIACIVVTGSAGGTGGTATAQTGPQTASSRLRVTPISVPEGTLRVYLPDDIAAGDTISGTVVAEPAGNTDEQRSRNTSVLNGYAVDIGTAKAHNRATVDGTPPSGTTTVPAVPSQAVSPAPGGPPGRLRSVSVYQLDVGKPGQALYVPASDWGWLRMTYVGSARVLYLNLTVNRRWVIRNVRVLSEEGPYREQAVTVAFGLGNKRGVRVSRAVYGIALQPAVSFAPPRTIGPIAVMPETLNELCTAGDGEQGLPAPKGPIVGGRGDDKHTNSGFVNQEAPLRGCVQTGFSNSLQWLKKNNKSMNGVKDEDITIKALGDAVGSTEAAGSPDGFIQKKKDYVTKKGIPVDTSEVKAADVGKKIDEKCDVEIWTKGAAKHFAAVVGISKGTDGKYSIDIAHDTKQNEAGGTTTETITYDPTADKISGGTWTDGASVLSFVVECPKKP
jgi:hypothetical protein